MSNDQPIVTELSADGSNLYIFFGGIAAGIAMPPLEFYNSSRIIDQHKIFIRDFGQCWYQDGLPGISHDLRDTAAYLRARIDEVEPNTTFFVGNSMGGYAAIMFGVLVGQGEVIAFAPQTFISPGLRLWHRDFRWRRRILDTYRRSFFKPKIWNLRPLLRSIGGRQKISVFVSTDHRLDRAHAAHIKGIAGVSVYEFDSGGHELVKMLRDQGQLPSIMAGKYA